MKYYIPTSSLNLDNILQSESISPLSFYPQRVSGYRSLEIPAAFRGINATILFDRPVEFRTVDTGRYDYPMLIEFEDPILADSKNLHPLSDGVYAYTDTIRLTPANCRIFFFDEKAYKLSLINVRDNKSIKYLSDYKIYPSASSLPLSTLPKIPPTEFPLAESKENVTDKLKGAAFAYILGQYHKSTPELAHLKKLSRNIYDQITGIISNFDYVDSLRDRFNELLKEFKAIDPTEKANRKDFDSRLTAETARFGLDKKQFIAILNEWDSWKIQYRLLVNKWGYRLLPLASELTTPQDFLSLRDEITGRVVSTIENYRKALPIPTLDGFHIKGTIAELTGMPLITAALNHIIDRRYTLSQLLADRSGLCRDIFEAVKANNPQEAWDRHLIYIDSLIAHIDNLSLPFSLDATDNPELKSIATFILRAHSAGDLFAYITAKEIADPTATLTLWGAISGYCELNREPLIPILTMQTYGHIFTLLFGREMPVVKWSEIRPAKIALPSPEEKPTQTRQTKQRKRKKAKPVEAIRSLPFASSSLLTDISWVEKASSMIPDEKSRSQFENDIRWFISQCEPTLTDSEVIDNLSKLLDSKRRAPQKWVVKLYSSIPVEGIIAILRSQFMK